MLFIREKCLKFLDKEVPHGIAVIIDSMKNRCPAKAEQTDDFRPYSMAEIDDMLDEAEAEISAGKGIPDEEVWKKYEEEFALEEQETLKMV